MLDANVIANLLPKRAPASHKGSFGRLEIWAGSERYPGSALLSARAALKAGCGYVYVSSSIAHEIVAALPEVIPGLCPSGLTARVMGPGLGDTVLPSSWWSTLGSVPLLVDGDGLWFWQAAKFLSPVVITPHPGEAAKLLKCSTDEIQKDREGSLKRLLNLMPTGSVAILKGSETLIGCGSRIEMNSTGSVSMASAGQGDVLSGIIGAYLAAGLSLWDAACCGVFVHGLAADRLAVGVTQGVLAHEVADAIPETVATLEKLR